MNTNYSIPEIPSEQPSNNYPPVSSSKTAPTQPLLKRAANDSAAGEISMSGSGTDLQAERAQYTEPKGSELYKVQSGDTLTKIASKFHITLEDLLNANPDITSDTVIKGGQTVKIPARIEVKNIKSLKDVAKCMGVSQDFIRGLKKIEDGSKYTDTTFHNTPYKDAGVESIGIGHLLKSGDPRTLTDTEVLEYFTRDLMRMEDIIIKSVGGRKNYEAIPQPLREALLALTFNKGPIIEETEGLAYCLKSGKYEAAINKLTFIKTNSTNEEKSGLAKRRLYEISIACKMYKGNIPQSNINTIQGLYDKGVTLLKSECTAKGLNYEKMLATYNMEISGYFGNRISQIKLKQ